CERRAPSQRRRRPDRREQGPMPYHRCPACSTTCYSAAAHSAASACPSCSAPLTDGSKLVVVPGAKHNLSRTLRAQPQAAAEARRAVVALALPEPTRE